MAEAFVYPNVDLALLAENAAMFQRQADRFRELVSAEPDFTEAYRILPLAQQAQLDQLRAAVPGTGRELERCARAMSDYRDFVLDAQDRIRACRAADRELAPAIHRIADAAEAGSLAGVAGDIAHLAAQFAQHELPCQQYAAIREWYAHTDREKADELTAGTYTLTPADDPTSDPADDAAARGDLREELPVLSHNDATTVVLAARVIDLNALLVTKMNQHPVRFERLFIEAWPELSAAAAPEHAVRMVTWYALTRTGGPWDMKAEVQGIVSDAEYLPVPGQCEVALHRNVWANLWYGYVGARVGQLDEEVPALRISEPDEDADEVAIRVGRRLAVRHPGPMTVGLLEHTLASSLDGLTKACLGPDSPTRQIWRRGGRPCAAVRLR